MRLRQSCILARGFALSVYQMSRQTETNRSRCSQQMGRICKCCIVSAARRRAEGPGLFLLGWKLSSEQSVLRLQDGTFEFMVFIFSGKPFVHPDGSAVVYNPAGVAPAAGRLQQQGKSPPQPLPAAPQQHFYPQVSVSTPQDSTLLTSKSWRLNSSASVS